MRLLVFLLCFLLPSLEASVDIQITAGSVNATVRGNTLRNGWIFLRIPYAEDPVGDLRFEVFISVFIGFSQRSSKTPRVLLTRRTTRGPAASTAARAKKAVSISTFSLQ